MVLDDKKANDKFTADGITALVKVFVISQKIDKPVHEKLLSDIWAQKKG